MNQRIRELAESCTVSCVDGRGVELNEIDVDKFAELIIQECLNSVDCIDTSRTKDGTFVCAKELIKMQFGISE